jgi:signal transduction histidine kinase
MRGFSLAKVFSLFLIGIILPTGFLVYLGVQSIRAENLLLRKESQERIGKTAEALQDQAQGLIGEALEPFVRLARSADAAAWDAAAEDLSLSLLLRLDNAGRLIYPVAEMRRHPPSALPPLSPDLQAKLRQAEEAEFKGRDPAAALALYRSLEEQVSHPRWRAILLTGKAGCLAKVGQAEAAEAAYQEIAARYGQELDAQGNPFGLVMVSPLAAVQAHRGRPELAASSLLKAFGDLLSRRWDLSWDELAFFARHFIDRLEAAKGLSRTDEDRFETLRGRFSRLAQKADLAKAFARERWPALQRTLHARNRADLPFLILGQPRRDRMLAYAPVEDAGGGRAAQFLLAEAPVQPLLSALETRLGRLTSAAHLVYRLEGNGVVAAASAQRPAGGRWTTEATLAQTDPPLRLSIASIGDVSVEQAAARRRQVYLAMVMLAALVIVIALYATWYAVSREVEVAQLKAHFVASMSHELKTPLSIIGLVGQKLRLGRYETPAEAQEYYAMLAEETDRLKGLIDDVLDFSRVMENRQPYHCVPADLGDLVTSTIERYRQSLPAGGALTLDPPPVCRVHVDPEALGRVLLNLLDNAVKYSPADRTQVRVSLECTAAEAVLRVEDQGYGIPPEEQSLVFDRFFRGKSATAYQPTKGAGLGLSIVLHIVKAHAGRIELQSEMGRGSIFSIHLPRLETA